MKAAQNHDVTMECERQELQGEDGIVVPFERINPDTLRNMIEVFVTREWSELADSGYTLDEKVDQVMKLLKDNQARIVYDNTSESWNIIPCR